MVQWLRLHAPKAGNMGLISDLGTKMLHSMQHSWKKKKKCRFTVEILGSAEACKLEQKVTHHSPGELKASWAPFSLAFFPPHLFPSWVRILFIPPAFTEHPLGPSSCHSTVEMQEGTESLFSWA